MIMSNQLIENKKKDNRKLETINTKKNIIETSFILTPSLGDLYWIGNAKVKVEKEIINADNE